MLRGAGESNPIAASSVLINAYVRPGPAQGRAGTSRTSRRAATPAASPREGAMAPEVETHLVNAVLTNGARYYVDHAHPEYSSPECADALEACATTRRGSASSPVRWRRPPPSCRTARASSSTRTTPTARATRTARHENYLMDRAVPFGRIVQHVMPHFVTRQIYTGAGKVGSEVARRAAATCRSSSRSAPTSSRRRSGSRPR